MRREVLIEEEHWQRLKDLSIPLEDDLDQVMEMAIASWEKRRTEGDSVPYQNLLDMLEMAGKDQGLRRTIEKRIRQHPNRPVPAQPGPEETGPEETGPEETGPEDRGQEETSPEDRGQEEFEQQPAQNELQHEPGENGGKAPRMEQDFREEIAWVVRESEEPLSTYLVKNRVKFKLVRRMSPVDWEEDQDGKPLWEREIEQVLEEMASRGELLRGATPGSWQKPVNARKEAQKKPDHYQVRFNEFTKNHRGEDGEIQDPEYTSNNELWSHLLACMAKAHQGMTVHDIAQALEEVMKGHQPRNLHDSKNAKKQRIQKTRSLTGTAKEKQYIRPGEIPRTYEITHKGLNLHREIQQFREREPGNLPPVEDPKTAELMFSVLTELGRKYRDVTLQELKGNLHRNGEYQKITGQELTFNGESQSASEQLREAVDILATFGLITNGGMKNSFRIAMTGYHVIADRSPSPTQ